MGVGNSSSAGKSACTVASESEQRLESRLSSVRAERMQACSGGATGGRRRRNKNKSKKTRKHKG